jgi:hypothetical protein
VYVPVVAAVKSHDSHAFCTLVEAQAMVLLGFRTYRSTSSSSTSLLLPLELASQAIAN